MFFQYIFDFSCALVTVSAITSFSHGKSIVCNVFPKFMRYGDMEYSDAALCTHVNCITKSFIWLVVPLDWLTGNNDSILNDGRDGFDIEYCSNIQRQYPHLKVLLNVNLTSNNYFELASTRESRNAFISKLLKNTLDHYYFDGFNLNLDYSCEICSYQPNEKRNFALLVKEMEVAFQSNNLSLALSFKGNQDALVNALDYATMQHYVEFIQFIPVEPTHRNTNSIEIAKQFSYLNNVIDGFIESGVSPMKTIIGIRKFCGYEREIAALVHTFTFVARCRFRRNWHKVLDCVQIPEKISEIRSRCIEFESARSIANQIRLLMKHNIAGVNVYALNCYDYSMGPQMAMDTFADFKTIDGITLNIPEQSDDQYPLVKTINEAMLITQSEIIQMEEKNKIDL